MVQFGESALLFRVPGRPVGRCAGANAITGRRTIGVIQRQGAPYSALAVILLVAVAQGQQRVVAQVGFGHAIEYILARLVAIQVEITVFVRHHYARRYGLGVVERAGDIGIDATRVPGTVADAGGRLEIISRALAYEVHGGRRVAGGGSQAVGAAHYLDAVVYGGIQVAILQAESERNTDAVELEIGDIETARRVIGAIGFDFFDSDAGGAGQYLIDIVELEIIHLGACDHRYRLRRFAQ